MPSETTSQTSGAEFHAHPAQTTESLAVNSLEKSRQFLRTTGEKAVYAFLFGVASVHLASEWKRSKADAFEDKFSTGFYNAADKLNDYIDYSMLKVEPIKQYVHSGVDRIKNAGLNAKEATEALKVSSREKAVAAKLRRKIRHEKQAARMATGKETTTTVTT